MKTSKKTPMASIFRKVGNQPPLPPPVQEGKVNGHAEEILSVLPLRKLIAWLRRAMYRPAALP